MGRLDGRVALVTGAARGLGAGVARAFASEGAHVVCADILDAAPVAEELPLSSSGSQSESLHLNVARREDVDSAIANIVVDHGRLDILVNNAGIGQPIRPIIETTDSVIDAVVDVNVKGVIYCARAAGLVMKDQGSGRIINIASQAGKIGLAGWGVYCASKFAVVGLTEVLALELGSYNVTVNCICPGTMVTDITLTAFAERAASKNAAPEQMLADLAASLPVGRLGTAEDVGAMAAWIASDEASFTTGASFNLTGGEQVFF